MDTSKVLASIRKYSIVSIFVLIVKSLLVSLLVWPVFSP